MQQTVIMLGLLRSAPSACALVFGVPRHLVVRAFQRGIRNCHQSCSPGEIACRIQTPQLLTTRGRRSFWAEAAKATEVTGAPRVDADKKIADEPITLDDVQEFESELDAIVIEEEDDAPGPPEESASPRRLSLLESNVNILEQDCNVARLFMDAATSRKDHLYLGLDISTQSTGYTVLRPSAATLHTSVDSDGSFVQEDDCASPHKQLDSVRELGEANLVEWGFISGVGSDGKKGDELDVGMIVEETLVRLAERCDLTTPTDGSGRSASSKSSGHDGSNGGLRVTGPAEGRRTRGAGEDGHVWVVGVEDFMRRFLPGKSNAKSIFALAQLNGIVKYACLKHLGAKANSFHPSTPRSFYGLSRNKPEGKDMKEIVHDFVLSQEKGSLGDRFEWPLSADGSKADASFDVTDAYLIARYSWHRDVFRAVADDTSARDKFAASFRALHSAKLQAAEERSVEMFMSGDMPAARGKRKLKPMTERRALNAHRKLQEARFTKAYETALMEWFQRRVLGAVP